MRYPIVFLFLFVGNLFVAGSPWADTKLRLEKLKAMTLPTNDFSQPEPYERLSGGLATSLKTVNKNSFSHSSRNMSFEKKLDFAVGNGFFKRLWVSSPASTQAADGLGPLFNARSCQRCHLKDGRGHPPSVNWPDDSAVSMLIRLSIPPQTAAQKQLLATRQVNVIPDPMYGGQLQDLAIQGQNIEGRIWIDYEEFSIPLSDNETVNLRRPKYKITDWGYGPPHPQLMISPRIAPPMIGLGLLEAISERDILKYADPDDKNDDGISGRPNRVWSLEAEKVMLGRFGWKAGQPTLHQQNAGAFSGDIGISSPLLPSGAGDCTPAQKACLSVPNGNSPQYENVEAPTEVMRLVNFYSRNLAVPARRDHDTPEVLKGKKIFYQVGCPACHVPKFVTQTLPNQPEQSEQLIWPYTDLLLHDMGDGLADHRPEGEANGREWRTPPLWGIGLTKVVNGHTFFLHDGRARNLLEAILWHGGEAETSNQQVTKLSSIERKALLTFLNSL